MTRVMAIPDGARGFDTNVTITPVYAAAFRAEGYSFAVRYVRRAMPHSFDLTAAEAINILHAGLGLMVVQHVAAEPWVPTAMIGTSYGSTAAREAKRVGIPAGVSVWCDLEGVDQSIPAQQIIDYCNHWYDAVIAAGYAPGLYVGVGCGLSAEQLYRRLKFPSYWRAYNLNDDQVPAVRGVQMRQHPYPGVIPGIPFEFDVDVAQADAIGDRPMMLAPDEWSDR